MGSFKGNVTMNTDGVSLDTTASPQFPMGAFYAIHDDGNATAFSLEEIADTLRLH